MQILDTYIYKDRGLYRTAIIWTDGTTTRRADTHCALTGTRLGDNYEQCITHCLEYGHYSAGVDAVIHNVVTFKAPKTAVETYIKAHSVYPQSTPQKYESTVNL